MVRKTDRLIVVAPVVAQLRIDRSEGLFYPWLRGPLGSNPADAVDTQLLEDATRRGSLSCYQQFPKFADCNQSRRGPLNQTKR